VRIAQLTAELAEARRTAISIDELLLAERADIERTKAELAEVRKQRDGHEFELGRIHAMYREVVSDMRGVIRERDAAITRATDAELLLSVSREACESVQHQLEEMRVLVDERGARLEAAQAEAAEMRQAVLDEPAYPTPITPEQAAPFIVEIAGENGHHALQALAQVIVEATKRGILERAGTAGRALAARVLLLEAVVSWAQVILDEVSFTEDNQAMCIDPAHIYELRDRVAALNEKGGAE